MTTKTLTLPTIVVTHVPNDDSAAIAMRTPPRRWGESQTLAIPNVAVLKHERIELARKGIATGSFRLNCIETPWATDAQGQNLAMRLNMLRDTPRPAPRPISPFAYPPTLAEPFTGKIMGATGKDSPRPHARGHSRSKSLHSISIGPTTMSMGHRGFVSFGGSAGGGVTTSITSYTLNEYDVETFAPPKIIQIPSPLDLGIHGQGEHVGFQTTATPDPVTPMTTVKKIRNGFRKFIADRLG